MTDADSGYHAARATSFASTAEQYERARPGYPQDLLDSVFAEIGIDRPRILDLGAGTGKLTRQLLTYGDVTAVEPLAEMRAQLELMVPSATSLAGSAESIPVQDGSIDVVTVGQAYHWFDQPRANPEIWRVLAAGGHLLALWNTDDNAVPWISELDEIMTRGDGRADKPTEPGWWLPLLEVGPWFTAPVIRLGSMTVVTTKQQLLERMESHSYLSIRPVSERTPVLDEVAALVASFPDPFEVPYRTEAYWCKKLPASGS
jgi:SAM-dependent methyltransferase